MKSPLRAVLVGLFAAVGTMGFSAPATAASAELVPEEAPPGIELREAGLPAWIEDRVPSVTRSLLSDPASIPSWADETSGRFLGTESPAEVLREAAGLMDWRAGASAYSQGSGSLLDELRTHAALQGKSDEELDLRELAADVATLPSDAEEAFARLLAAMNRAEMLRQEAFARLEEEELEFLKDSFPALFAIPLRHGNEPISELSRSETELLEEATDISSRIDHGKLVLATAGILETIEEVQPVLESYSTAGATTTGSGGSPPSEIGDAVAYDLDGQDTEYPDDKTYALIVDVGGNDTYGSSVGSGTVGVGVAIDLAGNDRYEGAKLGVGVLGIGILVDGAGSDEYGTLDLVSPGGLLDFPAAGSGYVGAGVLVDGGGDDTYDRGGLGYGLYGLGLVVEEEGDDAYDATESLAWFPPFVGAFDWGMSQGTGSFGVGVLFDRKGQDHYGGQRTRTPVFDVDPFGPINFSQGAAWGPGVGLLIDGSGDDSYGGGSNVQGGSVTGGLGGLVDISGDDHYRSGPIGQGVSGFGGVGVLADLGGNDFYESIGLDGILVGGQGQGIELPEASYAQAFGYGLGQGVLVDAGGDDRYACDRAETCQGLGKAGGGALLLDALGGDHYAFGSPGRNNATWSFRSPGDGGVGIDRGAGPGVLLRLPEERPLADTAGWVSGPIAVEAEVTSEAPIERVSLLVDGTEIAQTSTGSGGNRYELPWDTTTATEGVHELAVEAIDFAGQRGRDWIEVVVDNVTGDTGSIQGRVLVRPKDSFSLEMSSGTPVEGATVESGGESTTTTAEGIFDLALPEGPQKLTITKTDFHAKTIPVTAIAGEAIELPERVLLGQVRENPSSEPIVIWGDDQFLPENGVTGGSGTPEDPYRIEGWEIRGAGGTAIWLQNTTAPVVIRDVSVIGARAVILNAAVFLQDASNVTIDNCEVRGSTRGGIRVFQGSSNVEVTGCRIQLNGSAGLFVSGDTFPVPEIPPGPLATGIQVTNNVIEKNNGTDLILSATEAALVQNNRLGAVSLARSVQKAPGGRAVVTNNEIMRLNLTSDENVITDTKIHGDVELTDGTGSVLSNNLFGSGISLDRGGHELSRTEWARGEARISGADGNDVCDAGSDKRGTAGTPISFDDYTATSAEPGSIEFVRWEWGDGSSDIRELDAEDNATRRILGNPALSHTYDQPREYVVRLTVGLRSGKVLTDTVRVTVE